MDNKETIIRGTLILVGILFIIYGIYSFGIEIKNKILNLFNETNISSISLLNTQIALSFIIIGIIVYYIGRNWTNIFKSLTKTLISFALFFLSISIIFYSIYENTDNLTNSIQPSIDHLIASQMDEVLLNQIPNKEGEKVELLLAESTKSETLYNTNLTLKQANYFLKIEENFFGENKLNNSQKIKFGKFMVSQIYTNLIQTDPSTLEIGIPLSYISEISSQAETELENQITNNLDQLGLTSEQQAIIEMVGTDTILKTVKENPDLFLSSIQINENASLKVILSENEIKKTITIGDIKKENINLIWKNLGLNNSLSQESKIKIINILLSTMLEQFEQNNLPKTTIPIAGMGEMIPTEYKQMFSYDIFSENETKKIEEIQEIRDDCDSNKISVPEMCNAISITKYKNMMSMLTNDSMNISEQIPTTIIEKIDDYNTLEKLNTNLKEMSNSWKKYLIITIILFMLSFMTYYAHFKLFKRELINIHIPYFISKINLIYFIPMFLFTTILYLFLKSKYLIEFITKLSSNSAELNIISTIPKLEIFQIIYKIFDDLFYLNLIYLIISIIFYSIFYILQKKKVEELD